jgi:hypothetical protein
LVRLKKLVGQINMRARKAELEREIEMAHSSWETG